MKREKGFSGKRRGAAFIALGLLLIAAALSLAAYNLWDETRAGDSVGQAAALLSQRIPTGIPKEASGDSRKEAEAPVYEEELVIPDYVLSPKMDMPVETIKGKDYIGVLKIPSLELELPILSEWNDDNLKIAPCRYKGSAYLNDLIICGHNYKTHFLNLRKLGEGDAVSFTDVDGNVFEYEVIAQEAVLATAAFNMEMGDWDLTLFTCTVGGRTRVTIRCALVNTVPNTNFSGMD